MKKIALITGTIASVVMASNLAFATSNFADVHSSDWYSATVNEMVGSGVGFGVDSGRYAPNQAITRGEVAQMIYNALGKPSISGDSGFSDIAGSPYATAITYCQQQGIIHGYPDGTFGPNKTITRQEASVIIWNTFGNVDQNAKPLPKHFATQIQAKQWGNNPPLSDWQTFGDWGAFSINELALAGAIHGYPDGTFKPNNTITRAEMTQILDGVLHKVGYAFAGTTVTKEPPTPGLKDNGDGTSSFVNVPGDNADSTNNIPSNEENTAIALMEKVTIKFNGDVVTVKLPDTGTSAISWVVQGFVPYSSDGRTGYNSINGATLTYDYSNSDRKGINISLYQTSSGLGEAGMMLRNTNGQWAATKY